MKETERQKGDNVKETESVERKEKEQSNKAINEERKPEGVKEKESV